MSSLRDPVPSKLADALDKTARVLALLHDWIRDGKPARGRLYQDLVSTRAALGLAAADERAKVAGDHESRILALERRGDEDDAIERLRNSS